VSITFEYSFNAPLDLPELVAAVNRALGCSLVSSGDDDAFRCDFFGMSLLLERHHYDNDRDLNFADYEFQLSNKTWDGSALRQIQLEVLVLAAFALQETVGIRDGMLSYDMQRLLARYSGNISDPAGHIHELQRRLDAD
jgi:hypothetical protein